ncbi:hypothetical protein CHS0354_022390 [Potamilus streckersoni]|uniref:Uncharacterized protein n=1 Tax=Potamilus streckersoni TaxID=2493646 RepID=A0AAE0SXQ3_9BIVA|nr:hypothetical protein CHS0354_022390 [Potamilus streckersoni]
MITSPTFVFFVIVTISTSVVVIFTIAVATPIIGNWFLGYKNNTCKACFERFCFTHKKHNLCMCVFLRSLASGRYFCSSTPFLGQVTFHRCKQRIFRYTAQLSRF